MSKETLTVEPIQRFRRQPFFEFLKQRNLKVSIKEDKPDQYTATIPQLKVACDFPIPDFSGKRLKKIGVYGIGKWNVRHAIKDSIYNLAADLSNRTIIEMNGEQVDIKTPLFTMPDDFAIDERYENGEIITIP